ncbi:MAG: BolA/IbaG family iron-sulfur metabolism protein [Myxococcales bacterium]|nr:BolA/IbaG family iron-sulfur metabolism protein [Myxococcales bacterium]
MLSPDWIKERIKGALPDAAVDVVDTTGTGDHFEARVVSAAFSGKSMVQQHQLVFAPLKDVLATGELHALALKTYSPEQWAKAKPELPTRS